LGPNQNRLFDLRARRSRHTVTDQSLGMVQQHARWFTGLLVLKDLAAERVRGVLVDACDSEGRRVGDRAVAIGPGQQYRIGWRDLIQILPGRKDRGRPKGLDPTPPGYPLARFCRLDL